MSTTPSTWRCDRGVVVFLVARLHADVQLHAFGMQIVREFLQQRQIAGLRLPAAGFRSRSSGRDNDRWPEMPQPAGESGTAHPRLFRKALMSTQSVPSKLLTMGKTSMPVSSDFRNGMTLSSTGRTAESCITSKNLLVCSSMPCSRPSGEMTCSQSGKEQINLPGIFAQG